MAGRNSWAATGRFFGVEVGDGEPETRAAWSRSSLAAARRIQAAYRGWGIRGELYYLHGCAVLCQAAARGAAARRKAAARELQQATGYEPREAKHADLNITSVGGGRVTLSIRGRF